ncbi:MAG: hypothetical protein JWQ04_2616, partial [Pedosphaera sp.]|nr:hypothetical protein [Pedosphaera sp.]
LSPNDAFDKYANLAVQPIKLSGDCRYLLAHQRRVVRVNSNGISIRLNKELFNYRNADTGRMVGQTVLTWFNPELPEILTVTDMVRKNPFTIARTQEVPAMEAPPEILAQEMERIAQHQAHAKARYKILKPLRPLAFRGLIADRKTIELGVEMHQQRSAAACKLQEAKTRTRKIQNRAAKLQLPAGIMDTGRDGDEGTALMLEARRKHQEKKQSETTETL